MNLPNKITMSRIMLSFFIIILLLFPFDSAGIVAEHGKKVKEKLGE